MDLFPGGLPDGILPGASSRTAPDDDGVPAQTLCGEIEKVLFEAEDASYSVFRIRDGQGVLHCVVGPVSGPYPGQSVELSGKWEFHRDHGRRFRASACRFTLPVTREGVVRYLSSGLIKGIGRKYAQAIVDTFGEDTLRILNQASVRLREVPGLGKKRIELIRKAWKENSSRREMQIHMQSLGISLAYFNRIYKRYGDRSADIIRENPYRLASEVPGIGFLLADRIASAAGIGKADPKRMFAGVSYALQQLRAAGHVCMPEGHFLPMLASLLGVEESDAARALAAAEKASTAVPVFSADGTRMIYERELLNCEEELPRLLWALTSAGRHFGRRLESAGGAFPRGGKAFSSEQLLAVERAAKHALTVITGGPGVGKTTVISEIVRRSQAAGLKLALAAPTGRAAKRMSEATGFPASTIHRMLKWDPAEGRFLHDRANPLSRQIYVIDEVSMLDLPTAVALFRAIRPGSSVVIVGDPDQLPSVGPGNVLNDMIESRLFPVTRLTKIFRQGEGSGIIHAAHEVNSGLSPLPSPPPRTCSGRGGGGCSSAGKELSDFYWIEKEDPAECADLIERLIMRRIPARFGFDPLKDVQVLCPMNRGEAGTIALNERLQNALNGNQKKSFRSGNRLFRIGDKVMQVTNNYDKSVFNGDMGVLSDIDPAAEQFTVDFDSSPVCYDFADAAQIVPAYAVTVHKSQGSEFPVVIMPLLPQHYLMLQRNLLYTGITRAKKLMILIGSRKAVSMAVRNSVREPRYSLLLERFCRIGKRRIAEEYDSGKRRGRSGESIHA